MAGTSRKTIIIEIAALIVLALFFFVSVQRGMFDVESESRVYVQNELPTILSYPLYITGVSETNEVSLTLEQRARVESFKKKIFERVSSLKPLTDSEKNVIAISISTTTQSIPNMTIANQTLFQFSEKELQLIMDELYK